MKTFLRSHIADHALLQSLTALVTKDRTTTAELLADIAEVDRRKLYVPAAHPSMYSYCVHELRMSEDTAYKRIRAARAAQQFPVIFEAIADGRLNLNAVVLLAAYLKPENAHELLGAATHKTRAEIELLLAQRFPLPDLPTLVQAIAPDVATDQPASSREEVAALNLSTEIVAPSPEPSRSIHMEPLAARPVVPSDTSRIAAHMEPLPPHGKLVPLSADRVAWQLTVDRTTHEKLLYAKALLGHAVPSGDPVKVLDRALDELIEKLERRKFAKCSRPGRQGGSSNPRCIPARVRRAVSQRDGGQCTFVSDTGKRCEAREALEFDHVEPVARGGQATIDGMRLRCRAQSVCSRPRLRCRLNARTARAGASQGCSSESEAAGRDQALARTGRDALAACAWLHRPGSTPRVRAVRAPAGHDIDRGPGAGRGAGPRSSARAEDDSHAERSVMSTA